jgi:hypothetical protein
VLSCEISIGSPCRLVRRGCSARDVELLGHKARLGRSLVGWASRASAVVPDRRSTPQPRPVASWPARSGHRSRALPTTSRSRASALAQRPGRTDGSGFVRGSASMVSSRSSRAAESSESTSSKVAIYSTAAGVVGIFLVYLRTRDVLNLHLTRAKYGLILDKRRQNG